MNKLLCLFVVTILMYSCGNDDNNNDNSIQEGLLQGNWLRTSLTIDGDEQLDPDSCEFVLIFENSIATIESYSGNDCDLLITDTGIFSIQNAVLTISLEGDIYGGDIATLTQTTLVLENINLVNNTIQLTSFTKQ